MVEIIYSNISGGLFLHLYLGLGLRQLHELVVAGLAKTIDLLIEIDAASDVNGVMPG